MKQWFQKQRPQSVLGLSFDGPRVEAVVLRRTNGSVELGPTAAGTLPGDVRQADVAATAQALRGLLDAAEIRERHCVVALPAECLLSLQNLLPELSDEDTESLLQLEAENGFAYSPDLLAIARSRFRVEGAPAAVTQLALQSEHLAKLEQVCKAAKLIPVSFTPGVTAQQPAKSAAGAGVVALFVGDNQVTLLISAGGGVVALRTLALGEGGNAGDTLGRELRITLGQLAAAVREDLTRLRLFGEGPVADCLASDLALGTAGWGLKLERVTRWESGEFGVQAPEALPVNAATAVAARWLARTSAGLEYLPPRISAWQQFAGKAGSGKLVISGQVAAGLAAFVMLAFAWQQVQLLSLGSKWQAMSAKVRELEVIQQQIRRFRPWYDESVRSLSILRQLTDSFPENGDVTAKTIELRDSGLVICTGTASDNAALLKALDRLRAAEEVSEVQVDQLRGRSPLQFTFNFQWGIPRQP